MAVKDKAPCEVHPTAKRYSNGACSACVIEKQREKYRANPDAYKAYAKEYAKKYTRRKMTEAERLAYNARRKAQRQAAAQK